MTPTVARDPGIATSRRTFAAPFPYRPPVDPSDRARILTALALSILVHSLLLLLQFGLPGLGLPGLQLPWNERRARAPEITVYLRNGPASPAVASPTAAGSALAASGPVPQPEIQSPQLEKPRPATPARPQRPTGSTLQLTPRSEASRSSSSQKSPDRNVADGQAQPRKAPRPDRTKSARAKSRPKLIAKKQGTPNALAVPLDRGDSGKQRVADASVPEQPTSNPEQGTNESAPVVGGESPQLAQAEDRQLIALAEEQARQLQQRQVQQRVEERSQAEESETRGQVEEAAQQHAMPTPDAERDPAAGRIPTKPLEEDTPRVQAEEREVGRQVDETVREPAVQLADSGSKSPIDQVLTKKQEQETVTAQPEEFDMSQRVEQAAQPQTVPKLDAESESAIDRILSQKPEQEPLTLPAEQREASPVAEEAAAPQRAPPREEDHRPQIEPIPAPPREEERRAAEQLAAREPTEQAVPSQNSQPLQEQDLPAAPPREIGPPAEPNLARPASGDDVSRPANSPLRQAAAPGAPALSQGPSSGGGTSDASSAPQSGLQDPGPPPAREHAPAPRQPVAGAERSSQRNPSTASESGPIVLSDEQLASFNVERIRNVDLTRVDPQVAQELVDALRGARRRTIFGSADDDMLLKSYIDDWRLAVERNGSVDRSQSPNDARRGEVLVTVAIRSDGSIEAVTINRSGGRLDNAVQRIALQPGHYDPFPPELARKYDVIEIRRLWSFGNMLQILETARR